MSFTEKVCRAPGELLITIEPSTDSGGNTGSVGKYEPLSVFLSTAGNRPIDMTFDEVGALVGGLPASAARWSEWWSNESGEGRHV